MSGRLLRRDLGFTLVLTGPPGEKFFPALKAKTQQQQQQEEEEEELTLGFSLELLPVG
jgi:hypothetical protein